MIENILIISVIITTLTSVIAIWFLIKALSRIDNLEQQLTLSEENNLLLNNWLVDFRTLIFNVYKKLKSVDERGIFEKDDDVGFAFSELLEIIKECNRRISDDDNSNEEKN